jgi:ribosomal protein L10
MKKEQKTNQVKDLAERFGRAKIALVSEYRGITAVESTEVRRRLRAIRGEMRVAKNTLVRRAIKDTAYQALDTQLGGQVGLILSFADPVELAKTVTSFKELGDKLKLRGGVLDGKALTAAEIQALAALPPREVILANLLAVIQAPATNLVRLLNEPGSSIARLVDAIGKKNGASAEAASAAEAAAAAPAPESQAKADAAPAAEAPKAPAAAPKAAGGFAAATASTQAPSAAPKPSGFAASASAAPKAEAPAAEAAPAAAKPSGFAASASAAPKAEAPAAVEAAPAPPADDAKPEGGEEQK